MKNALYVISIVVALVSGTSLIHLETEIADLRRQELSLRGTMVEDQLLNKVQDRIASATEGWVSFGERRRAEIEKLTGRQVSKRTTANRWATAAACSLVIAVLAGFSLPPCRRKRALAGTSLIAWTLGISLPVLTLRATTEVSHLGTLVLREETKSLLGMIGTLWKSNSWLLLIAVALFGIGVPLAKTLCQIAPATIRGIQAIGAWLARWAFVDVVAVALIVLVLSARGDAQVLASQRLGFWFFLGSAVISMLAGKRLSAPPAPHRPVAPTMPPRRNWSL